MGILNRTLEVCITGYNIKHYRSKGYECEKGDIINVSIEDVTIGNDSIVQVQCDCEGCTNIKEMTFRNYISQTRYNRKDGKYRCKQCGTKATIDTNLKKYGVPYLSQSPEIKEKIKKTNQERYGGNSCACDPIIKAKQEKTLFEHYGVTVPSKSKDIQNKIAETMYKKYGVRCPIQNEEIKNKTIKTNLERYGVENPSLNQDVKNKIRKVLYKNQNVCTSSQQLYLYQLYGGELNYPIQQFSADIVIGNLNIEYDGSGHKLRIKLGTCTQEEFNRKQIIRDSIVKREGYKIIRIISCNDLIPPDETLLQMLKDAKQYFKDYPEHSWINFDIDNQTIKNAEYERSYFYGELRKITKEDLKSA